MMYDIYMKSKNYNKERMLDFENKIVKSCRRHRTSKPKGQIRATSGKKGVYLNIEINGKRTSVSADSRIAQQHAQWKMMDLMKKEAEKNIRQLEKIFRPLEDFRPTDPYELREKLPLAYRGSVSDEFIGRMGYPTAGEWAGWTYEHYNAYPEGLIHTSARGINMRSRAEVLIADSLDTLGLPYHYEEVIHIDGKQFVPDFTIMIPGTWEIRYLEHLGMMDDPAYLKHNLEKISAYTDAGIMPYHDILYTYETSDHALDSRKINTLLRWFFELD